MANNRLEIIRHRLTEALSPTLLELADESQHHIGHQGNAGGGHYSLRISSAVFAGKTLVENHRLIYQCLQDLMPHEIHALSISIVSK